MTPENLRAVLLILAGMVAFTTNDALVKLLTERLPVGQVMFVRGIAVVALLLALLRRRHRAVPLAACLQRHVVVRALLEAGITFCFLAALARMPIANATTLFFSAPIMLTVLAALVLGEQVGPRRWAAVVVGFVGVVIVAGPRGEFSLIALLPVAAAAMSATRDIVTRFVPPAVPSIAVSLASAATVAAAGLITAPGGWPMPTAGELALMLVCSLLVTVGYLAYVAAIRLGEVSLVAPVRYTAIPFAMLAGYLLWGHVPAATTWLGTAVIIGSGLFIFHRARRAQAVAAATSATAPTKSGTIEKP
ncbi:DMT family transporter [Geminicoccaceae bacterium 1502E]|nr:DMT family transporter [Geminicoccaceae bacterium 1502E]